MYKQFYSKLLLLVAMIVAGAGTALADPVTGTITFGTSNVKINASRVENAADDLGNEWTIVTLGTTSFTLNSAYCQVGSAKAPATTITFQLTLPQELNITSMSAKFGGFNGTAGNVSLKVGSDVSNVTEIGTGSLNGTNDVVVTSTSQKAGQYLEVEVTDIDKGVKCYYISYTYELNGTEKTAIATIGDLTPTALNINDEGVFQLPITFATNDASDYEVTWTSNNTDVLGVDNNGNYLAYSAGNATVTVSVEPVDDETYYAVSKDFPVTVIDPNGPGMSKENPYTVAQARAAIDAGTGVTGVYAKGIVSKIVTPFNETFGNISYNISEDGTEEADQLEAYRGFSYNGEWFTSADDIQVGDEVVIYGNLKKYNSTYEFDANNQLVSLVRPQASQDPVITAEDVNLTYDATSGEIGFSIENPVESYNVTASADVDWISNVTVAADANKVTFTTTANEGSEAREGNITINYGGTTVVTSKVVKVTQGYNEGTEPVIGNGSFVKVTSTDDITSGDYLIVYETGSKAFDGSLETLDAESNTIDVTIADDKIAANETTLASVFTLDVKAGTVKSASGNYIGVSSNSNGLKQTDNAETYTHTFSIDDEGNAVIAAVFNESTMTLRFNKASNQDRFRYYKSGQEAIQLYKYVSNEPEPTYYLAGSWDGETSWGADGMLEMTKNDDGTYSVSKEFTAEYTEFKIYKKDVDESETWYGGATNDEKPYRIYRDWYTAPLSGENTAKNFIINEAGNYTFTVDVDALTLTVTGFPAQEFFLAGSFNEWSTTANQFEIGTTENVYTLTQELEAGVQFKVVSEGNWYGYNGTIDAVNCTDLALSAEANNMTIATAGTYTFTLTKTQNGLFLTIDGFPEPVVKYFLAGSWENGWTADGMVELNEQEDGSFINTINNFEANTEFKIVKDVNGAKTWFGGLPLVEGSEYYLVNKDWCTDIVLKNDTEVDGGYKNFKIEKAGDYTFKVTDEGKDGLFLDVAGWVVNYALVTDANQLEAGKDIILVGENNGAFYALGEQKTNNRGAVAVTKEKGIIAVNHSGSIPFITLDSTEGEAGTHWGFDTDDGYLYAASSSSNHLKTLRPTQSFTSDANAQATIEIAADGQATIVFQGTNSHNDLRFNNDNSNNLLFSCYTSDKTYPHAYIYMETELDEIPLEVTITDAEWATYVAEDDVTFPEGVTAYVPTTISTTSVGLTQVSQAMKGEAVIVNGDADNYQLAYAEEAISEKNAGNKFEISDGTVSDGTQYVLSNKNQGIVGFYKVKSGVTIPTGKPYLVIENAAKDFVPFGGGEATGIETIDNEQWTIGDAYDLQGRKVQKLSKGIFIQNGRKIVVK